MRNEQCTTRVGSKILGISLLFLSGVFSLSGQELQFRSYTIRDGFSKRGTSYAHSILEDREGFVWFSTYYGLVRFDGEQFKRYTHDPDDPRSIGVNLLTVVEEDDCGRIWTGTATHGIYIYDKATDYFFSLYNESPEAPKNTHPSIYFITRDFAGNMWWGHSEGLRRWNSETGIIDSFDDQFDEVSAFLAHSDASYWIGTADGLYCLEAGCDNFEKVPLPGQESISGFFDLFELENGNVLLSAAPGIAGEYDPATGAFYTLSSKQSIGTTFSPTHFTKGLGGDVWMHNGSSIQRFNQRSGKTNSYRHDPTNPLSLPPHVIVDLLVDQSGNVFIQTLEDGIVCANTKPHSFEHIGDFNAIEFLALDSTRLLIRDFRKGGLVYNTEKRSVLNEKLPIGPGTIYPPTMALRGDSLLWFLENQRVKSYHLKTGEVRLTPRNPVSTLYVHIDPRGKVWNGLSFFDEQANKWVNFFPELQRLFGGLEKVEYSYSTMHFDEQGNLWILINGYYGLIRYNLETGDYKHYPVAANSFCAGTGGRFYVISTEGFRIYQPEQDSFLYIKNKNQADGAAIFYAIEDLNGGLWLMTSQGLQYYDLEVEETREIDAEDGCPSIGQTVVRRSERDYRGNIYFDINMGKVVRFHPDSLTLNQEQSEVHLLDFFLNSRIIKPGRDSLVLDQQLRFVDQLRLNYTQSDFGFSFTMPVFYKSEKIRYYYRLTPFQKAWQSNGYENQVNFTNIDPGRYTFEVKAQSASGVWSTNIASVEILIRPPWWQTWWARTFFFLSLAATILWLWHSELNRRMAKAKALRLQEIDSLKTRLYTNITHEFRTPLTVIMGIADNIKEPQERNLIKRNSENLLRLINQLLDLSKLDAKAMKVELVQGDFIEYLRYLTESFHSIAQTKNIALLFQSEIDALVMDFDEVKVQHIVYNLLSNAIKFTPAGGQVLLKVEQSLADNPPSVKFSILDNGIGISEADQLSIFDRFYQADDSSTRRGEGTGIGLALTKELVQIIGGNITLKSRRGDGSSFSVDFPVVRNANTARLNAELERAAPPAAPQEWESRPESLRLDSDQPQLLLIEDNKDVAIYIQAILQTDYSITTATNGREGIEQALQTIPDIIISDVMMPEKDGFEVCRTLKTDERTSHIPIILLTAKAEQQDKLTGLQHGADAYLMKPFDKKELFIRLDQSLKLRQLLQNKYSNGEVYHQVITATKELSLEDAFLTRLRTEIEQELDNAELTVEALAQALQLSNMQLYRKVKALTGKTPTLFVRSYRLHKALHLLRTTSSTVSEIAYLTGFTSPAYFSRAFKEELGQSPSSTR